MVGRRVPVRWKLMVSLADQSRRERTLLYQRKPGTHTSIWQHSYHCLARVGCRPQVSVSEVMLFSFSACGLVWKQPLIICTIKGTPPNSRLIFLPLYPSGTDADFVEVPEYKSVERAQWYRLNPFATIFLSQNWLITVAVSEM